MAWNERELSFDIYDKGTFTADDLLERGYRDVLSFGPILMENGMVRPNLNSYKNYDADYQRSRTGVGQVEPGHFVVIIVDSEKPGIAKGLRFAEMAELFKNEGCVSAYNLDGGQSVDIVFMGFYLRERDSRRHPPDALLFGHTNLLPAENDPKPERYTIGVDENGNPIIVLK